MRLAAMLLTGVLVTTTTAYAQTTESGAYAVVGKIAAGGSGHWDYLTYDPTSHRLFMSHNTHIEVIDTMARRSIASIEVGGFTHGIAIVPAANRAYVVSGENPLLSNASAHEVAAIDLATLKVVQRINVADDPDGITYDPASKNVFAFSGDAHVATVLDGATGRVVKTIALEGSPEGSVADGAGHVFVNVKDMSHVVEIDSAADTVTHSWPLKDCENPTGLAINVATHRLFSACKNEVLNVLNSSDGSVVTTASIQAQNDGVAYDPGTRTIFVSTLLGTMSILRDNGNDNYAPLQTLQLPVGSRTLALDGATHSVYVSSAAFDPIKPGQRFPSPTPGTFNALIVAPAQK